MSGIDTVLVAGFEPFGGESINPSALIAESLHGENIRGRRIEAVVLPVTFADSLRRLVEEIERTRPKLVMCLGQAGGEEGLCIERVAINLQEASIPDNEGKQPLGDSIVAGGPVAYWSSLPVVAIADAVAAKGIAVRVSNSAGTFVCNHVFYGLMNALGANPQVRGGFVHVPFLPEQLEGSVAGPSMPLATMTEAIRIAIEAALGDGAL